MIDHAQIICRKYTSGGEEYFISIESGSCMNLNLNQQNGYLIIEELNYLVIRLRLNQQVVSNTIMIISILQYYLTQH